MCYPIKSLWYWNVLTPLTNSKRGFKSVKPLYNRFLKILFLTTVSYFRIKLILTTYITPLLISQAVMLTRNCVDTRWFALKNSYIDWLGRKCVAGSSLSLDWPFLNSSWKMYLRIIRVFNADWTSKNTQLGLVVDPLTISFRNIHSRLQPLWIIIYINFHVCTWNKRNYLSRHLYHISIYANRVDRHKAALTREAWSGSTLFAKALKGVSVRLLR